MAAYTDLNAEQAYQEDLVNNLYPTNDISAFTASDYNFNLTEPRVFGKPTAGGFNPSYGSGFSVYKPTQLQTSIPNFNFSTSYKAPKAAVKTPSTNPLWGGASKPMSMPLSQADQVAFESTYGEYGPKLGPDPLKNPTADPSFLKGLFGDADKMSAFAGLAGTALQAIALPEMLKNARLQNKSLSFNLATAKEEQGRRNNNIASFNNYSAPAAATPNKSAFV